MVFFIKRLKGYAVNIMEDVDGATFSSFKSGGKVSRVLYPTDIEGLIESIYTLVTSGEPYKIIGNGTNVLISDKGYFGTLVSLKRMRALSVKGTNLYATGGVNLAATVQLACENGLAGLEFCSGIPASVGGAVSMNAGAFGIEMADKLSKIEVLNGTSVEMHDRQDLFFGYRTSDIKSNNQVVLSAQFALAPDDIGIIKRRIEGYTEKRNRFQPSEPSVGSVFKKANEKSAGWYIDRAGLKGYMVGGAVISMKHANFIVNKGGASTADYIRLADFAAEVVNKKYGVTLEREVELIGD